MRKVRVGFFYSMPESFNPPFWLKWISFRVRPEMSFSLRRKIYLTNGAAFVIIATSIILGIDNYLRPELHRLLPYNAALIAISSLTLLLVWRAYYHTAFLIQAFACISVFAITGSLFFNATENYLLLTMTAAIFVYDRAAFRYLMGFLCGTAFVIVKCLHFESFDEEVRIPLDRYFLNITIFTSLFFLFMETLRRLIRDYLTRIEHTNAELARQRRILDEERNRLLMANLAKEKLFSMVSHDLRGPVGNLKLALESMQDGTIEAKDFAEMQADLKIGVDRVYESLDDLLHWAAGQMEAIEPNFQTIKLREVAQESLDLLTGLAHDKNISLENRIELEARVRADRHQVGTIFRNLVANAIKFTPENGCVKIEAEMTDQKWVVAVTDTGVGITSETLMQLFDTELSKPALGTHNEKGWGLGLQICRDFIEANGGTIRVESTPGKGSTFYFTLASADETANAS